MSRTTAVQERNGADAGCRRKDLGGRGELVLAAAGPHQRSAAWVRETS